MAAGYSAYLSISEQQKKFGVSEMQGSGTGNPTMFIFNAYYVATKLIVLAVVVISCGHIASTICNSFCIFLSSTVGLRNS